MLCPCYCSRFSNTLSCVNSPRKCSIFMTHIVENKLNFLQRVFNFYFTEVDGEFSRCKQILYLACENLEFSNSNWSVSNSSMNPFLFTWITKHHPLNHSRKMCDSWIWGVSELGLSVPVDKVDNVEHYAGSAPATIACNDDGRSVRIFPKQLYRFYLYFPLDIFYRLHLFAVWWCYDDSNFVPV